MKEGAQRGRRPPQAVDQASDRLLVVNRRLGDLAGDAGDAVDRDPFQRCLDLLPEVLSAREPGNIDQRAL